MALVDNDLTDPEDAYDVTDPPGVRIVNFIRRLTWIKDHLDDLDDPRIDLDRLDRLLDDLETLRNELGD